MAVAVEFFFALFQFINDSDGYACKQAHILAHTHIHIYIHLDKGFKVFSGW